MKRILMTIGSSINGGAQRLFLDLASSFSKRGYEVGAAIPAGPLEKDLSTIKLAFREVVPLDSILGIRPMSRTIGRFRPDIIQAHLTKGSFISATANLRWRTPICAFIHNAPIHEKLGPFQRLLYPSAYRTLPRLCDGIIVASEAAREELHHLGLPSARIEVIPLGIDISRFRVLKGRCSPTGKFRIGAIGRLSPEKGHKHLVRALELIKDLDWQCQIVGQGPCMADLKLLIDKLALEGRIELLGFVDDQREYLANFDVFVLPSINDAFPLAVIEAFLAEKPVIATDVGGLRTLVQHGTTGLIVPAGQPEALADAIRYAAGHRDEMASMAARAKEIAMKRFTIEGMAETMVRYMEDLAAMSRAHRS